MKKEITKAIILAGGYSRRMKLKIPKQLVKINNKPLLVYSLDTFERCKAVDGIILVVHRKIEQQCRQLIKRYGYKKIEQVVTGGRTRQQSVFNALTAIRDCDYVVIHDGVRPFVTGKITFDTVKAAKSYNAATCAVQATDTIIEAKDNLINSTLCRDKLWHIQTPQAFKFDLILKAHQKAKENGLFDATDDTQLVLRVKQKVRIVKASRRNFKVTAPFDLNLAKTLL